MRDDYNNHYRYHLGSSGSLVYSDKIVTVAQHGPERSAFNRVVGGSNPPRDTTRVV